MEAGASGSTGENQGEHSVITLVWPQTKVEITSLAFRCSCSISVRSFTKERLVIRSESDSLIRFALGNSVPLRSMILPDWKG